MTTSAAGPAAGLDGRVVGRLREVLRYPVKSMAGSAMPPEDRWQLGWAGIEGDRRWAYLRPGSERSGFPWHTIRENPRMVLMRPVLREPDRPDRSIVDVEVDGRTYEIDDPELADRVGVEVRLVRLDRGAFDAVPVSLISTGTVDAVCGEADVARDHRRFRPNLLVDTVDGRPFAEDGWIGSTLALGDPDDPETPLVRLDRPDSRCVITDVDPSDGAPGRGVLKSAGRLNGACAGVYGSVVRRGSLTVGAAIVRVG